MPTQNQLSRVSRFISEYLIPNRDGVGDIAAQYSRALQQARMNPDAANRLAYVTVAMLGAGYAVPGITSLYRSPGRQKLLQERWDAGNRVGLVARPATRSWHMQGRAVDVRFNANSPHDQLFRYLMEYYGFQWGGRFRSADPVHFQYVTGGQLRSINELLQAT